MNKRIKELALQANGPNPFYGTLKNQMTLLGDDAVEKFAELLIKECAEICRRQQYYDADDEHKRGVNGGSITCMNAIKREFGVE